MPDCIEREALLKHSIALNNPHELGENVVPVSDIEAAPAADVETVVHGRWIYPPNYVVFANCSCCGCMSRIGSEKYNYCPNCGAKMDKEDK